MARDSKYDILFEPVQIGPKQLRNRFYKAPHCTSYGSDLPGIQAYFRGMAAEGGWAAINTEYCSVHPSSDDHGHVGARLWDKNDVRNLGLMCEKIHEHGALAGAELWYGSAHAVNYESRLPAAGVSQISSDYAWMQSCYELDLDEIKVLQGHYVDAAIRGRDAGFDLINVYGGHGHPITYQFLDPYYNKRSDAYGGSFENRSRFWLETIEKVRAAVGEDCAVVARICLESLREGGLKLEESGRFIELADDLIDMWDVQLGGVILEWGEDTLASRFAGENYQKPWIERIRPHTKKPLVGVGRFTNADTMVEMVRSGLLDIIGSARGSIADPFLPKKIEEGRLDDIRECIGCNVCAGRYNQHALMICTQNATAGEEYRRGWHPEKFSIAKNSAKDVLVVGAGPAGLECALVLGKRGMNHVHLVDTEGEVGGNLRWISQLPGLGEWARVINHRKIQIDKLRNVDFIPAKVLDAESTLTYGAELVVVATGSHWVGDGTSGFTHAAITGADSSLPYCATPEQVMVAAQRKELPGNDIVVYDCDGYFMAVGLAEKLVQEGRSVTLVTPFSSVAPYTAWTLEAARITRNLYEIGVNIVTDHLMSNVSEGQVQLMNVFAPDRVQALDMSAVVLVTQRRSNVDLYRQLTAQRDGWGGHGVEGVFRIGDCVVPRLIADAVFDGHRLAREIDTADPAVALPFIRENRVIGATDDDYDNRVNENGGNVSSRLIALSVH